MLVHGGLSKFVTDEDVAEFLRRLPSTRYEVVDGAGHAVQSDRPLELVALIEDFAFEGKQLDGSDTSAAADNVNDPATDMEPRGAS